MKNRKLRAVLLSFFAATLLVLIAVFSLLFRENLPKVAALEPHIFVTPTPGPETVDDVIAQTPAPTARHTVITPAPRLPEHAVNLLSDGTALFALDSRETAELLIRNYYQQCAYEGIEKNAVLLNAKLVSALSTVPADGSVDYLSYEEALAKLYKNRALISVQRTVERAEVKSSGFDSHIERSSLLPDGSRMYRLLGSPSRTLELSEIIYKDGFASSDTNTQPLPISNGAARSVLIGTYRAAQPDQEPQSTEGVMGKSAGALSFVDPVRGTRASFFGTRFGTMHYGIDYTASPGARIVAPEAGTVIFCGERQGYGFIIDIRHENGFVSRLASCDRVKVELYQHVVRGEVIAYLPAENVRSASLHYELIIDNIPHNPTFYLP